MPARDGDPTPNFLHERMDRRRALKWMGGTAFAVTAGGLLVACGDSSSGSSSTAVPTTVKTASQGVVFDKATTPGGTMTLAVTSGQSEGADPLLTFGQVSLYLSTLCFDRLVTMDRTKPGFTLVPRLAESWTISDDASTYTLKIRKGVTFHDGSPLTAEDIAFNLRRFVSDKSLMKGNFITFYQAGGVKVLDQYTVQVKLTKPNAMLMHVFREWNCSIYPKGTTDFEKCVGTGPFKFEKFNGNEGASVTKNTNYWQPGMPFLDAVRITVIPEADSALQALQKGQIDAIAPNSLDQASVQSASKLDGIEVLRIKNYWMDNMQINPYIAPYTDVRLRQAAALAIDPKIVADQMFQGDAVTAANIPVAPDDPFYPPSLKAFKADIPKAKQLLAAAGYPNGVELDVLVSDDARSNPVMQLMANQLELAGFKVKLNTQPKATWTDAGNGWGTGKAWEDGWWLKHPITMALYQLADTPGYRTWGPPEAEAKIEQAFITTDEAKQIEIMRPVFEQASAESGNLIPVIRDGFVPVSSKLRGLNINTFNLDGFFEQVGKV